MSTYRITNITPQLGKRDVKYNSKLIIDYIDGMNNRVLEILPNDIMYLTVPSLPISLHKFRMKKWVTISEISSKELKQMILTEKHIKSGNNIPINKGIEKDIEIVEDKKSKSISNKPVGSTKRTSNDSEIDK